VPDDNVVHLSPRSVPAAELSDDIPFAMQGDPDLPPPPTVPSDAQLEKAFWASWERWDEAERREKLAIREGYIRFRAAHRAGLAAAAKARAAGMSNKDEIDRAAHAAGEKAGEEAVRKDEERRAKSGNARARQRAEDRDRAPPWEPVGETVETPKPNFRSMAAFIAEFRPISYAVAGLMREDSVYTMTGRTGEGKTTLLVALTLAVATGDGERLIGRKVKQGRVAFATAENPDDLRMRFMVACYCLGIDARALGNNVLVSDNRVRPEEIVAWAKETGEAFTLIVADTWQAFFDGREPNNNAEAVGFTRRFRPLAAIKGNPVVLIAAHPPKQAGDDSLLPYGGGATLNEVDGNFTLLRNDSGLYRFHWLGKIRGLPFDPLHFRIEKLDSPDVVTVEDSRVPMPVMFPVSEEAVEARQQAFSQSNLALLMAIAEEPGGSERKWAAVIHASRRAVSAALRKLKGERLVTKTLGRWRLTKAGERVADEAETEASKRAGQERASGPPENPGQWSGPEDTTDDH
jgi:hypothetical protein